MRRSPRTTGLFLILACAAGATPAHAQRAGGVPLLDAARLSGRSYTVELTHAIAVESGGQTHAITRDVRTRFTFLDARGSAGNTIAVTVRVDSLRASMSTPHGREVIDGRRALGATFGITVPRNGGPARYAPPVPALASTEVASKELPVSLLVDYAFPLLPDRSVRAGDTWERSWTRVHVDGQSLTERTVTGRFRVIDTENRAGSTVARISVALRGAAVPNGAGPLEAEGTLVVGMNDGVLRELQLEEKVGGSWEFGGDTLPFRQTGRIRVSETSLR